MLFRSMAQATILMLRADKSRVVSESATYMLAGVKARFLKPVVPGDQLRYVCEAVKVASMGGVVEAEAFVNGEVAVKASLTFSIRED